jgi:succinyl-CoA synthetase beta subunit
VAVQSVPDVADLQYFVSIVVDDLHSNPVFVWSVEGTADGRIQAGPSRFVYLGLQGLFSFSYGLSAPVK